MTEPIINTDNTYKVRSCLEWDNYNSFVDISQYPYSHRFQDYTLYSNKENFLPEKHNFPNSFLKSNHVKWLTYSVDIYCWTKLSITERMLYELALDSNLLAFGYTIINCEQRLSIMGETARKLVNSIESKIVRTRDKKRALELRKLLRQNRQPEKLLSIKDTSKSQVLNEIIQSSSNFDTLICKGIKKRHEQNQIPKVKMGTIYVRIIEHPFSKFPFNTLLMMKGYRWMRPLTLELQDIVLNRIPCTLFIPKQLYAILKWTGNCDECQKDLFHDYEHSCTNNDCSIFNTPQTSIVNNFSHVQLSIENMEKYTCLRTDASRKYEYEELVLKNPYITINNEKKYKTGSKKNRLRKFHKNATFLVNMLNKLDNNCG